MTYRTSFSNLGAVLEGLASAYKVIAPVEKGGKVNFEEYAEGKKVNLSAMTVRSAKDAFFPQSEDLMKFRMENKTITVAPKDVTTAPYVLFGVRACDLKSFEILDRVFLADPVDEYYKSKREAAVIFTLACKNPEDSCFCTEFSVDPSNPMGDVTVWTDGEELIFRPNTEKGKKALEHVSCLVEGGDEKAAEVSAEIKRKVENLPLKNIGFDEIDYRNLKKYFDSDKWESLHKGCLACGTCTFVCPTCQCYDIRDYDDGKNVRRFRCWDSCMYSDFTMMAHGNNRTTHLQRFRQRFMHKLVYFPTNNDGIFGCVGCGRCVRSCPVHINIVKAVKALKEDK